MTLRELIELLQAAAKHGNPAINLELEVRVWLPLVGGHPRNLGIENVSIERGFAGGTAKDDE
jgi:hypothetical protein